MKTYTIPPSQHYYPAAIAMKTKKKSCEILVLVKIFHCLPINEISMFLWEIPGPIINNYCKDKQPKPQPQPKLLGVRFGPDSPP